MNYAPQLTQSLVQNVPPGHLFLSQNDEGVEVIFLMLAQGSSNPAQYSVVQMVPRSTATSWTAVLPPDQIACDVNDSYVLSYEPAVDNFQFVETSTLIGGTPPTTPGYLITGQLALLDNKTCLVVLGINPAIGYGLVDISTGEFLVPAQPFPELAIVIQKWELRVKQ